MLRTLILFIGLLPLIVVASGIQSLEWSAENGKLIALTNKSLIVFDNDQITKFDGPSANLTDATLFDHDSKILLATDQGAYVSDDYESWSAFNEGLDTLDLAFVFTNVELQTVLYAATQEAVYKYTPEENAWVNMDAGPGGAVSDYLHSNMPDSMDTGWIFASTSKGITFTSDCFCFWRDARNFEHDVLAIAYQPEQPSTYFAATSETLYVTSDGARTFSKLTDIPFNNTTAIVAAGLERLFIGTQDGHIWQYNKASMKWTELY